MERLIRQMLCTTILTGVGVFCLNSGMASTSLENQSANSVGSQQVQAASLFNPDPVAKGCTAPICKEVAEDDVKMLTKKCASKTTIPDKEKALDTRYLMYPSGENESGREQSALPDRHDQLGQHPHSHSSCRNCR